jgi:regulation of enolase protein 1 (concanavalin A-like superfamily)
MKRRPSRVVALLFAGSLVASCDQGPQKPGKRTDDLDDDDPPPARTDTRPAPSPPPREAGPPPAPSSPDAAMPIDAPQATVAPGDGGAGNNNQPVVFAMPPAAPMEFPPGAWQVQNIGSGTSDTKARYFMNQSATYVRLETRSMGIGQREDSFQFVSQAFRGDVEIIGRLRTVDFTSAAAQAGLMIRASAMPNAPYVFIAVSGGLIGHVQARTTVGGETMRDDADKANIRINTWLRLLRTGRTVKAFRGDRRTWTEVGSYELPLSDEIRVGVAATSGPSDVEGRYEFDGVRVNNFSSHASLAGWFHEDIGLFGGVALFEGTTRNALRLHAFGNPWTATNDFHGYAFREAMGDHTLTFRLRSIEGEEAGARIMALIRNGSPTSVSRGHAHVAAGLVVGTGLELRHRDANGANAQNGMPVADIRPPVWLRIARVGKSFTGSYSPDGRSGSWKDLGTVEANLGATVSVGLAVSSNSNRKMMNALIDNITLTVAPGDGGAPDAGAPSPDAARDVRR